MENTGDQDGSDIGHQKRHSITAFQEHIHNACFFFFFFFLIFLVGGGVYFPRSRLELSLAYLNNKIQTKAEKRAQNN